MFYTEESMFINMSKKPLKKFKDSNAEDRHEYGYEKSKRTRKKQDERRFKQKNKWENEYE